jgi:hypothetical protein
LHSDTKRNDIDVPADDRRSSLAMAEIDFSEASRWLMQATP